MEKWRIIPLSSNNAYINMAIDEAVANAVSRGLSPPTVRFYTWEPSAVSIGYFQRMDKEVDVAHCTREGIDFIRRNTGGGAVYHDSQGEITYSVIAPEGMFPKGIIESYKVICSWIVAGLAEAGISAEFRPINDIVTGGKKISGNAQTRRNGVLLQHGTILYDVNPEVMFTCLKVSDEKIRDKMISAVHERVTSVKSISDVGVEGLYKSLLNGFSDGKEWSFRKLSENEVREAERLAEEKYKSREWNFLR